MPPLRSRKEDIPLMVQAFLKDSAKENSKPFRDMSPEAMACIINYDWPGNVRELRAAIEHAVVMSGTPKIGVRDLPASVREQTGLSLLNTPATGALNLHQTETALILRALEESAGNRTEAAKRLGISRRTLHRRLKDLKTIRS